MISLMKIPDNSLEWLKTCEARTVMNYPKKKRRRYYEKALKHRGESGLRDLQDRVNAEWRKNNALS